MKHTILVSIYLISLSTRAQLYVQRDAEVHLQKNSGLFVQGDMVSHSSITGHGTVYFSGDSVQRLNLNGFNIPVLSIQNKKGIDLTGNLAIDETLTFNQGILRLNNSNLELKEAAVIHVEGDGEIVTNSTGIVRKRFDADVQHYFIPLANANGSTPVILSTKGKYYHGYVEVASIAKPSSFKPADAEEYIDNHWKVSKRGIEGSVEAIVQYKGLNSQAGISGYMWEGHEWKSTPEYINHTGIMAKMENSEAEIFAMKRMTGSAGLKKFTIHPNPAIQSTRLTYFSNSKERGHIILTNLFGQIVKVQNVELVKGINQINVNLGNLTNGHYKVILSRSGINNSLKLIKQ